jgi:hypothetical protein
MAHAPTPLVDTSRTPPPPSPLPLRSRRSRDGAVTPSGVKRQCAPRGRLPLRSQRTVAAPARRYLCKSAIVIAGARAALSASSEAQNPFSWVRSPTSGRSLNACFAAAARARWRPSARSLSEDQPRRGQQQRRLLSSVARRSESGAKPWSSTFSPDGLGADADFGEDQLLVWRVIERAASELPSAFTVQEVLDWFAEHHPDVLPATVRAHMSAMAGNSPAYLVHPTFSRRPPILWRVGRGTYEPYDPRRHGAVTTMCSQVDEEPEDAVDAVQEFVLEQYLEEFLSSNWDRIAFGRRVELWSPDDRPPRQFDASPAGRLDFLCRDLDSDALVVVELKRGTPSDAVIGQTLRYMGWIRREIARPDQRVEGIVVVGEPDEKLLLAASATPAIRIVRYRIDLALQVVDERS